MIPIPGCCAMPLDSKVGDSYICITCGTTYRRLIGGWTLAGPIVDLAPELQAADPTEQAPPLVLCGAPIGRWLCPHFRPCPNHPTECPYETKLDPDERTGN